MALEPDHHTLADHTVAARFHSSALAPRALRVVGFEGEDEISRLYRYAIELVAEDPDLDLDAVIDHPACLGLHHLGEERRVHGILSAFEQHGQGAYYTRYQAVLVPRLWLLGQRRQSRVFQNRTAPQVVEDVLTEAGFVRDEDYALHLTWKRYPEREYVVQYRETDLDFVSRLMEHEGLFFYFEQDERRERVVITDDNVTLARMGEEHALPYVPGSGLSSNGRASVQSLTCRRSRSPGAVVLKDYNYRKPGLDLGVQQPLAGDGKGQANGVVYDYGDHYKDKEEGGRLAQVRTEALRCRQKVFTGESDAIALRSGLRFSLSGHYRRDFDREYLLTRVMHHGRPVAAPDQAYGQPPLDAVVYRNELTAIPAEVPFRPERVTPKPRVHGAMNARVDAAGDGKYAELDDQGRYKVTLPFDLSGRKDGKASRYLRMCQPYAGADYGHHFPLHKGTEVLWTCVDGDPDRPVIAGAVPNPATVSPVTSKTQTQSRVRTAARNELMMEDLAGSEQVMLHCPYDNTRVYLGHGPSSDGVAMTTDGHGVLHAREGIYLNAWPSDHFATGDAAKVVGSVVAATQAVGVAATAAGGGSLAALPAAMGVLSAVTNVALPGIVLSSPSGVSAATPSTFTALGGAGAALLSPAGAEVVGVANASLMSGGGVNVYTIAGGIRTVASRGDVDMDAKTADVNVHAGSDIRATAEQHIAMQAKEGNVHLSAHQEVDVTAAESDITVQALKANVELVAKKRALVHAEDEEVRLECGDASITLRKDGHVLIRGKVLVLESEGASLRLDDANFSLEADKKGELAANTLKAEATGSHTLKGRPVKIN